MNLVTPPNVIDNNGSSDELGTRKGMVIASLSINSLLPHVDEIEYLLKSRGIDFLALNETKIDDKLPDNLFKIDGYKFIRFDRTHHGGEVAFYSRGGNLTCLWYGVVPFFRVPFS